MIGVNIDSLNTLIKKSDLILDSLQDNSKKIINCINDLNNCYSGSSLEFLFYEPVKEINNIKTISSVVSSYADVLKSIKTSYLKQDESLKYQVNHINSKL